MLRNKLRLYTLHDQRSLKRAVEVMEEDASFNGNRMITREGIPNLNLGTVKLKEFIEKYFFPPVAPFLVLHLNGLEKRDFGDLSNAFLHWSVTKKTSGITNIKVAGTDLAPDHPNEEISEDASTFDNSNSGILETPVYYEEGAESFSFFMYVTDTLGNLFSKECLLAFLPRRFWFASQANLIDSGQEALSLSIHEHLVTSEKAATRSMLKTLECHNAYLYLLWPVEWGGINDNFKMNGKIVNDWAGKDFVYTNPFNYNMHYRIFRSRYRLFATYQVEVTEADLLP